MLNFLFTKTPLLFFVQSFWRDESFSYLLAKRNIFEMMALTAKDFNPPLYYLILHYWMKLFGTSEIATRSLSLIFFWLILYTAYLFMENIMKLSRKKSFLYLLLFLINPFLVYYAFEARMYAMLAFFASLSFYAFYRKDKRLYLIATVLGLYTHYFMIFVIAAQLLFSRKLFKQAIQSVLFFIPWLIFIIIQKGLNTQSFWIEKPDSKIFTQLIGVIYSGYEIHFADKNQPIFWLSSALMIIVVIGALFVRKTNRDRKLSYYLILWSIGIPLIISLISFVKPIYFPRYFIFSCVGFLLFLVMILENLPVYFRMIITVLLVIVTLGYLRFQIATRAKSDVRRTVTEIKSLAGKNDVLYVTDELDFFDAQYYFDENRVFIYGKSYEEIPAYVGKIIMPKSKFVYILPVYPRKAFILTDPDHYDIQATF